MLVEMKYFLLLPQINFYMIKQELSILFANYLKGQTPQQEPKNLYEPMQYILSLGGKRVRPGLCLMGAEAYGGDPKKALPAAFALEVFHNFTLLHDDIMDQAEMRRGKPTVHKKWDKNTAILSGDVMLIKAYESLEYYEGGLFKKLVKILNQTAREVCEGQQYDLDFESQKHVSEENYMEMIRLKTSVLLGAALQMGAAISQADEGEQQKIYELGIALGLAFQLQDDYLDTFGKQEDFGKIIGGDILERKKTWLYIKAFELANLEDRERLLNIYSHTAKDVENEIESVKQIFSKYNTGHLIRKEIEKYSLKAQNILQECHINDEGKKSIQLIISELKNRNT